MEPDDPVDLTVESDDIIDLTVETRSLLPQIVAEEWLPNENQSILFLFQFDKYPPRPSHYILPSNFLSVLHQDEVFPFDFSSLSKIEPPVHSSIPQAYQKAIKKCQFHVRSVTLQPQHGNPITLPVWIFIYWTEIKRAVDTRERWKVALEWIRKKSASASFAELRSELLLGLSGFSWSRGAAYTADITPVFANSSKNSYLNSFHIDHMMEQTRVQYEEKYGVTARRHIFTTVDQFGAILQFYGRVYVKKEGAIWRQLMGIENRIIEGDVDTICGIIHIESPEHWVSVVINFQQCQVLYGDSLHQPMEARKRDSCDRWIKHLIGRSTNLGGEVTVSNLPTGHQADGTSCGLFALNSIAHHYLGSPLLPTDSVMLNRRRMEIGRNIISTMMVCLLHIL